MDAAAKAVDAEIERLSQLDSIGAADAHSESSVRRMFDGRLEKFKWIGDGLVVLSYLLDDEEGLLFDADSVHVGVQHLETELGTVLDWRSRVAESLQFGIDLDGVTVVRRRAIQLKRRVVTAVQSESVDPNPDPVRVEFGRVLGAQAGRNDKEESPQAIRSIDPEDVRGGGFLLAELEASRDGRMRQAVATIQLDQNRAIRASEGKVLIIEGGPGTGKTLVGLHRVAKVLYDLASPSETSPMLVLGPNPRFIDYISGVLPSLGEHGATTLDFSALCLEAVRRDWNPIPSIGGEPDPHVARVKGDPTMATLLRLVAWSRVRAFELRLRVDERLVVFRVDEVDEILKRAREAFVSDGVSYSAVQESVTLQLRNRASNKASRVTELLAEGTKDRGERKRRRAGLETPHAGTSAESRTQAGEGASTGGATSRSGSASEIQVVGTGRGETTFEELTRQLIPDIGPLALVQELLTSSSISDAIDDPFAAMTVRRFLSRSAKSAWTTSDLPLIDESAFLLGFAPRRYRHVVVDEAQDLSAMAWRAIGRRLSNESLTILGDLNQSTEPAAVDGWPGALQALGIRAADILTLGISYRLPKPVLEYAARALPAADRQRLPTGLRNGDSPEVRKVENPPDAGDVAAILSTVRNDQYVGVITTNPSVSRVAEGRPGTVVLTPEEAKGLEFDVAIVVEPGRWCDESEVEYRRLFIALSRPTQRLVVLHHHPLPRRLR